MGRIVAIFLFFPEFSLNVAGSYQSHLALARKKTHPYKQATADLAQLN
jgi:hypothetical protein